MFSFLDHVFDIWTVSMTLGVDVGVAFDMFRADVRHGGVGNTGKALPEVDFAALKEQWDAMTEDEQFAALDAYSAFVAANYRLTCRAYPNGREAVDALVSDWRGVGHEDN